MKTIGDIWGYIKDPRSFEESKQLVDNTSFIGLEIELEGIPFNLNNLAQKLVGTGYWSIDDDGSLRNNGVEFKMGYQGFPLRGMDVIRALTEFRKYILALKEKHDVIPSTSERTSIHSHIDVRDLTELQLKHFIFLYIIFEDAFFNMFKKHRRKNNYCRNVKEHYDYFLRLGRYLSNQHNIFDFVNNGFKYDAMNYKAIEVFGSVEFRLMEGSFDTKKILKWINLLLRLKSFSINNEIEISEYPEQISMRGLNKFLNLVFKEDAEFISNFTNEVDLLKQLRLAQKCMRIPINKIDHHYNGYSFTPIYIEGKFPVFDKFLSNLKGE